MIYIDKGRERIGNKLTWVSNGGPNGVAAEEQKLNNPRGYVTGSSGDADHISFTVHLSSLYLIVSCFGWREENVLYYIVGFVSLVWGNKVSSSQCDRRRRCKYFVLLYRVWRGIRQCNYICVGSLVGLLHFEYRSRILDASKKLMSFFLLKNLTMRIWIRVFFYSLKPLINSLIRCIALTFAFVLHWNICIIVSNPKPQYAAQMIKVVD